MQFNAAALRGVNCDGVRDGPSRVWAAFHAARAALPKSGPMDTGKLYVYVKCEGPVRGVKLSGGFYAALKKR